MRTSGRFGGRKPHPIVAAVESTVGVPRGRACWWTMVAEGPLQDWGQGRAGYKPIEEETFIKH